MYYLNSRYYSPEIGRFISADTVIGAGGIQGYNLYIYCLNNPINMSDLMGNWPKFIEDFVDGLKTVGNRLKKGIEKAFNFISETVGTVLNINKEEPETRLYGGVFTYESGVGYNTSVGSEKTITFFTTAGEKFWENGSGIDVNVKGNGVSFQWGNDTSVSLNLNGNSITRGRNNLGRLYTQYNFENAKGVYQYHRFSLNLPEILLVGVYGYVAYVYPYVIPLAGNLISR